jgi:hypothetical protein
MRECAVELLERTERALLEIFAGDVRTNAEEAWTLGGFRLALQWVIGFRAADQGNGHLHREGVVHHLVNLPGSASVEGVTHEEEAGDLARRKEELGWH